MKSLVRATRVQSVIFFLNSLTSITLMRQYVTLHPCYANNSHSSVPKGGGGGLPRASLNTKSNGGESIINV